MRKIYDIWFQKLKLSIYVKKILVGYVQSFAELYQVKTSTYKEWGLTDEAIYLIQESKKQLDECRKIILECEKKKIEVVGYFDAHYPQLLKEIPDPPMVLYMKGRYDLLSQPMVGMVGARKCTEYGDRMARNLGQALASYGIVVVSGLAMGADAASHEGALKYGGTVGVLGTGVDQCYPECNRRLYEQMLEEGCILSEYEPGIKARPYHFPRRNRIIAGLCYGILVVEAAKRSGSLITAQLALDYGRDVYAVPGEKERVMSEGTNALILSGAKPVVSAEDIIDRKSVV